MSEGIVEQLQDRVSTLEQRIVKLCARSGHAYEEAYPYQNCGGWKHPKVIDKQNPEHIAHTMKCEICETWKCQEEL